MNERLGGKFYAHNVKERWDELSYCIRMTTDTQLHLSFDADSISFAGFMLETERDKYLAEWTDEELVTVREMIHTLYTVENPAKKQRISGRINGLKDAVQRRAGIRDT